MVVPSRRLNAAFKPQRQHRYLMSLMMMMGVLTNVVSNNAAAVIGTPIAIGIAQRLGLPLVEKGAGKGNGATLKNSLQRLFPIPPENTGTFLLIQVKGVAYIG